MSSEHFPRIKALWNSRETLSRDEWREFYQRVMGALAAYRPRESTPHGEALHDLRHQFFIERVVPGEGRNGPEHEGALRLYFRRFLLDLQRSRVPDDAAPDNAAPPRASSAGSDHHAVLHAHGLSLESVRAAADAFVASLPEDMQILLRHSGCDSDDASQAERIALAHHRGGMLGLVHPHRDDPHAAGRQIIAPAHGETVLSRWIVATLASGTRSATPTPPTQDDAQGAQALLELLCTAASGSREAQADSAAASQGTA